MATRILIAQSHRALSVELSRVLGCAGFSCDILKDGQNEVELAGCYSLVLLDMVRGRADGPSVCAAVRARGVETPVVFVSSSAATEDRIRAFRAGADDFIARPYDAEELVLRLQAVIRRTEATKKPVMQCRIGGSVVDLSSGWAVRQNSAIALTRRELELLRFLNERRAQLVSREELLREVWRYASHDTRTVDVHLATLRRKLEHDPRNPEHLITVRRRGYMLAN
jgi:DNA-binding response OmpR family regulator